jgi:AraC-like DNA-binding protein
VLIRASPAPPLRGRVTSYYGFEERTAGPKRRREGPGRDVLLMISFGEEWSIDDVRLESFAAGLHERQVTTEHFGHSFGLQVGLAPPVARALLGPLHELAGRAVPLDEPELVERLYDETAWSARFRLLDEVLLRRLADARPLDAGVAWAWRRLVETDGAISIATLTTELGWTRKRIAARFREHVGLTPKRAARLLRFERARELAEAADRPDWARIALACGYYDQSHLINDFREVTGRTPETFFQDGGEEAA